MRAARSLATCSEATQPMGREGLVFGDSFFRRYYSETRYVNRDNLLSWEKFNEFDENCDVHSTRVHIFKVSPDLQYWLIADRRSSKLDVGYSACSCLKHAVAQLLLNSLYIYCLHRAPFIAADRIMNKICCNQYHVKLQLVRIIHISDFRS